MFKSVFAKYVTALMLIFVIGFAFLLFVMTSIVNNALSDSRADAVKIVLTEVTEYVQAEMNTCLPEDFSQQMTERLDDPSVPLSELICALIATDSDLSVSFADLSGSVFYRIEGGQTLLVENESLPQELVLTVVKEQQYLGVSNYSGLTGHTLVQAGLLDNAEGQVCGIVTVSSLGVASGFGLDELNRTVVSAALLILLAILIAVYFISERITSPLRGMYAATKQFANGEFDVRVPVSGSGRDEVAQLAKAFNQMAESLENLENMRNSFIANISHDLRTPMTTIIGFIEEIRDGVIPIDQQDHYLEIISNEAKRLSRLVNTLLEVSRIQAGERKFTPTQFDICEMGRVILISFEQQIDEKQLKVAFECDEDRMIAIADYDAIYQILYNICHNAVKFSIPEGVLRLRIHENREHKFLISIYNEGQGIPEADLPYVFERFYKSDKSRGLDKNGVGLGMFISKTIIQAHGESIWVESKEGKYCEFLFTLPKADSNAHGNG